jgi:hypothetical protein
MKNKLILHLIFLTFLIGNTNSLETVLFQFTLDEQVQTSKDNEDIIQNESTELKSDKYWNKPFTKLDYYLMQIKDNADKVSEDWQKVNFDGSGILVDKFEKVKVEKKYWSIAGKTEDIKVSNNVFFNEDKGKIIIGMSIKAGKPKKPLKETCKNLIENSMARSFYLPSQKIVPSSPNKSLLNLLYRGGTYENYNEQLEKVANNIVYVLSITSEVLRDLDKGGYDYFNMTCYKLSSDEDIIFRKWSFASNK